MQTSEARIRANQANAAKSTGPKTVEGKERSRRNSLKHGMTGAGVVLIEADSAEVERRAAVYADELIAVGEIGEALARRAALNSVRMERGADQRVAALTAHVRQVEADFVTPEDFDDDEAKELLAEAVRAAMFDPSPAAVLAARYEAAAERGFIKAVRELRQIEREAAAQEKAERSERVEPTMASFLAAHPHATRMDAEFDAMYAELEGRMPELPANSPYFTSMDRGVDVPITVGRGR